MTGEFDYDRENRYNQPTANSQQPIHVHFNLQHYYIKCGFNTYETELTRRLMRYDDIDADPFYFSRIPHEQHSEDLQLRRVHFPDYLILGNGVVPSRRQKIISRVFKLFMPFISSNSLIGGKPEDTFIFFDSRFPKFTIKGKTIAFLLDIIPLRFEGYKGAWGDLIKDNSERLVRKATKVITCSEYSKKDIIDAFGTDERKIEVIYCAVNAEDFSRDKSSSEYLRGIRSKYGLPEKYILHFGNCLPHKNVEGMIRAYAMLPENLRAEYGLVIPNPNGSVRKCAGENGVSGNVIYTDKIPDEDKPGIYQLASLFAWPSYIEGFGIPILEAQASGVPVVSSNAASMPEVGGDSVIYFDPYDTAGMSEAMRKCLTDEILHGELVAKGYENVKRFSWDKSAKKFHDIIRSLY